MIQKLRLLTDIIFNDIDFQPGALGWLAGHAPAIKKTLNHRPWMSLWVVPKTIDSVLRGISQVCFADNPLSGLLILLGLFLGDVWASLAALACSLAAIVTALIFKQPDAAITSGITNFSAVLVGTVITSVYPSICHQPMPGPVWGYMIVGAAFSVCLLSALGAILAPTKLPPFTLPFNIAACIAFVCLRGRGLVGVPPDEALGTPDGDEGVLWDQVFVGWVMSVGQVYALESLVCSCLALAGLLLYSPVLVLFAMAGALVSSLTALAVSSAPYTDVYAGVWGYNGFLSAGSLAIFMVPSLRVFLLALVNAAFTTVLQASLIPSFALNQLPVFTFPFCISSLLFLAMAGAGGMDSVRVYEPTFPERHFVLQLRKVRDDANAQSRSSSLIVTTA
ncbi:urea transporter 1-like [Penaeus japonicus]|uniref:urea transporter 1-like n=1 Tax=Penaeus japonicus TaxID=27405 RepID=UPI001C711427|nr:urea transporter 1-like [Penaeus japonicus]